MAAIHEGREFGVGDFVLLEPINMDTFMENLEKRYRAGKIYTYIGEVVVSVNPYKKLNIYEKDSIEQYRGREIYERPPHIFAVADAAYKAMKRRSKDTCIVISGTLGRDDDLVSSALRTEAKDQSQAVNIFNWRSLLGD